MSASIWAPGTDVISVDAENTLTSEAITATNGQTVFNLTVFTYVPGSESLAVFRNGQKLIRGVDFSETSSTSFTLTVSPAVVAGEVIEAVGLIGSSNANAQAAAASAASASASAVSAAASAGSINPATFLAKADNLAGLASPSVARGNLGLGTAATQASSAFASSGPVTGNGNTLSTARLLGRTTADAGAIEEISVGAGLTLAAGVLSASVDSTFLPKVMCIWNGIASTALSYSRSGTTVTVTHAAHGYATGAIAEIISATDGGINGVGKVITVVDANTYQFQTSAVGANGTLVVRTMIRKSYNVASITTNGTADYTIAFTSPTASKDYWVTSGGVGNTTGSGGGWGFTPRDYTFMTVNNIRGIWGTQNSAYEANCCTLVLT